MENTALINEDMSQAKAEIFVASLRFRRAEMGLAPHAIVAIIAMACAPITGKASPRYIDGFGFEEKVVAAKTDGAMASETAATLAIEGARKPVMFHADIDTGCYQEIGMFTSKMVVKDVKLTPHG